MAPRSFSDDGASGAFSGGASQGGPTPPTMSDPGPSSSGTPSTQANNSNILAESQALADGVPVNSLSTSSINGQPSLTGRSTLSYGTALPSTVNMSSYGGQPIGSGFSFSRGGAVPDADGDDDGDTDGSPGQDLMAKALQSVDATLQYSYQKYGLGGGQQEASAMPTVPGTQSNSGIPPQQPMPGPLPPTSNPFGKRADAGDGMPGNQGSWEGPLTNSPSPNAPPQQGPVQPIQQPFQPLAPTSNPFGKRADDTSGAIDTDDNEAA